MSCKVMTVTTWAHVTWYVCVQCINVSIMEALMNIVSGLTFLYTEKNNKIMTWKPI